MGVGRHGHPNRTEHWLMPDLWSLHLYRYHGELTVAGTPLEIAPGRVSVVPPGTAMRFRYRGPSTHLFAHLRLADRGPRHRLPAMNQLGAVERAVTASWQDAIASFTLAPRRCQAELWTVLWRLAAPPPSRRPDRHPVVEAAVEYLELHLAEPIPVPLLAAQVGISHNQLTRLFRQEFGCSVVAYLRRRRVGQAEHLLRNSTQAIASIAASVGIPDLQAFNKTVRRELGRSPRAVRAAAVSPSAGSVPGAVR